jgi:hypothetical protein
MRVSTPRFYLIDDVKPTLAAVTGLRAHILRSFPFSTKRPRLHA